MKKYIIAAILLLLFVMVGFGFFFMFRNANGYLAYYLLDDFDDIVETLFEVVVFGVVIVVGAVFLKKIWHKL